MADITIPQLNAATSVSGTDLTVISQAGVTKKVEVDKLTEKVLSSSVDVLHMNPNTVQTLANIGELAFNPDTQTLEVKCSADVTLSIGQENYIRGKNAEASTILNGTVVYVSGGIDANSLIKRAGNAGGTAERVIGVATQDIGANNIGFITTSGIVNKLNTSAYAEADLLWLGTNGTMTNIKPDTTVDQICIGVVLRSHATEGSILVSVKDDWRDKLAEVRSDLSELEQKVDYVVGYDKVVSIYLEQGGINYDGTIDTTNVYSCYTPAMQQAHKGDALTVILSGRQVNITLYNDDQQTTHGVSGWLLNGDTYTFSEDTYYRLIFAADPIGGGYEPSYYAGCIKYKKMSDYASRTDMSEFSSKVAIIDTSLYGELREYEKPLIVGSIDVITGAFVENHQAVSTQNLERAIKGDAIQYGSDIYFRMLICNADGTVNKDSGWKTEAGTYLFDENCLYRFIMAKNPMEGIDDAETMRSKIQYNSNGDFITREAFIDLAESVTDNTTTKTITVAHSGGDFTSVRDAVASITDANKSKKYKILIKNGTYDEIDIKTKDYVYIEGESRDGVVLKTNGMSTDNSPSNYNFHTDMYSNVAINSIPKAWKHLFVHVSNSTISNLTMVINNCKYVIHQDGWQNAYNAIVENCIIKRIEDYTTNVDDYDKSLQHLIGIGASAEQFQYYKNCEFHLELSNVPFDANLDAVALLWHNWQWQNKPCGLIAENCNMFGCGIVSIWELGSEQKDNIRLNNCHTDSVKNGIYYDISEISVTQNYNITLHINGCNVPFVLLSKNRLEGSDYVANPITMTKVQVSSDCKIGQPVIVNYYGWGKNGFAENNNFGFAMQNVLNGDLCYINKGSQGYGYAIADDYTFGDAIYINNGKFTKVANGMQVGVAIESITLQADGLLRIAKLT